MRILVQISFIAIITALFIGCGEGEVSGTTETIAKKTTLYKDQNGTFSSTATLKPLDDNSTVKITRDVESDQMTVLVMSGGVEVSE